MPQIQVVTVDISKKILKQLDWKHSLTNVEFNMLKVVGRFDSQVVERGYPADWLLVQIGSQSFIITSYSLADSVCKEKCKKEFMQVEKLIILK